ncbi:MAG TPA: hypothetical protein VN372_01510 [Methanospirillum sp.]|nr:hypothetical protein [Methanospirillum sp.]
MPVNSGNRQQRGMYDRAREMEISGDIQKIAFLITDYSSELGTGTPDTAEKNMRYLSIGELSIMMKLLFLVGLLMVIGITTCGCTQPTAVVSPDNSPSPSVDTVQPANTSDESVGTLSNDHPNNTFSLDPGVFLLSFETVEPQFIKISPKFGKTKEEFTEINTSSPYSGRLAFHILWAGDWTFNITSTGTWTAQLSRMDTNNPLTIPLNLSGSGTNVSSAFTLEKGEYIFERKETGAASPRYELMNASGWPLMDATYSYVQPEFGWYSTETFRIVTIPESGTYFLSVYARESDPIPWNVSIIALPPAPQKGPGPAIHG